MKLKKTRTFSNFLKHRSVVSKMTAEKLPNGLLSLEISGVEESKILMAVEQFGAIYIFTMIQLDFFSDVFQTCWRSYTPCWQTWKHVVNLPPTTMILCFFFPDVGFDPKLGGLICFFWFQVGWVPHRFLEDLIPPWSNLPSCRSGRLDMEVPGLAVGGA